MATLGFERGTAFLSQQLGFQRELAELIELARSNGAAAEPVVRQELADSYVGVQIMKYNGMRMLTSLVQQRCARARGQHRQALLEHVAPDPRRAGDARARRRRRPPAGRGCGRRGGNRRVYLDELQRIFLFSRSETIYAGASEIQRNIIGERVLGLPREPR